MSKYHKRFMRNFLAFCIDTVYVLILAEILFLSLTAGFRVFQFTQGVELLKLLTTGNYPIVYFLIAMSINAMIQEGLLGYTLGKKMMGLMITDIDYKKPTTKQIIIRNLVYPVDTILILGAMGLNKKGGKCLGDKLSKTLIVDRRYLLYIKEKEWDTQNNIEILLPDYLLTNEIEE